MGSVWLHDLPQAIGHLGPTYYPGWEVRSRSSGGFDAVLGVLCHHTASSASGSFDGYNRVAWTTHPSKPVANISLGRGGEICVGVAGASNHAGKGGPRAMSKGTVPLDAGNKFLIGIEALNTGVGEPWPQVQTDRYLALVSALCSFYGFNPASDVISHHEWTPPRKIDPAGPSPFGSINRNGTWDMNLFRSAVAPAPGPGPIPQPPGDDDMKALLIKADNDPTYYAWNGVTITTVPDLRWVSDGVSAGLYVSETPLVYPAGLVADLLAAQGER